MKKNLYFIPGMLLIILITTVPQKSFSQLLFEGPYNPGSVSEEFAGCLACAGSTWLSHPAAMVPDSQYATTALSAYPNCFMTTCFYARALMPINFGFSIPAGSAIQGIKVDVLRKAASPNTVHDSLVQLVRGGQASGGNRAAPAYSYPVSAAYTTYGDSADLWDTVWTTAEINSTDFGFYFKPLNKTPGQAQALVDHVQVTVYYLGPTGVPAHQTSSGGLYFDAATQHLFLPHGNPSIKNGTSWLAVYDARGRLVFEKSFAGEPPASIKTELPGSGIYIANFSDGKTMQKIKFFIPSE